MSATNPKTEMKSKIIWMFSNLFILFRNCQITLGLVQMDGFFFSTNCKQPKNLHLIDPVFLINWRYKKNTKKLWFNIKNSLIEIVLRNRLKLQPKCHSRNKRGKREEKKTIWEKLFLIQNIEYSKRYTGNRQQAYSHTYVNTPKECDSVYEYRDISSYDFVMLSYYISLTIHGIAEQNTKKIEKKTINDSNSFVPSLSFAHSIFRSFTLSNRIRLNINWKLQFTSKIER